jgi:hypothetical protein
MMTIGIIREGKTPPDKRVPLTPTQARQLSDAHRVKVLVQSSDIRAYTDQEYRDAGVEVVDEVHNCDVLMGVKEVPIDQLIAHKTYFFFSHTIKEQPYNRDLLRAVLNKNIRLVDYEVLTRKNGSRVVAFGRYAGIVGAYNGILAWGKLSDDFALTPAHLCYDRAEMNAELKKVTLPSNFKIVLTGTGRVSKGAQEVLKDLGVEKVSPLEFLDRDYNAPVYTVLEVNHYFFRADNKPFDKKAFYENPVGHIARFTPFTQTADMYIPCHYWDSRSPFVFINDDARNPECRIKIVADVSCDIDGPVVSTLRPSTIADPLYGYDPHQHTEVPFGTEGSIGVMAVDNLPCELPRDASRDFGAELMSEVLPYLLGDDPEQRILRASITDGTGELGPHFTHLKGYVEGV